MTDTTFTSPKTLVVVSGGLSEESATHRLADALSKATVARAAASGVELRVERLDVRDLAHELASASLTGFAAGALAEAYETLGRADAVIAVSPTYKASYTGLFKAFWDVTEDGVMAGVPVVIGATGGTPRHSLVTETAMRPLFAFMKAMTMPTAVYAAAEDWGHAGLASRLEEAASELATQLTGSSTSVAEDVSGDEASPNVVRTLGSTRDRARDPFGAVPTMADMLRS